MKAARGRRVSLRREPQEPVDRDRGAAAIAQTGIPGGEQAIAYAVFALVGTIGVAAPGRHLLRARRARGPILDGLKRWMAHDNGVIMAVLLLVIGAKLIGDGIAGLSS